MDARQVNELIVTVRAIHETMTQILQTNKLILEQLEKQSPSISATFTQNGSKCTQSATQSFVAGCNIKNLTL